MAARPGVSIYLANPRLHIFNLQGEGVLGNQGGKLPSQYTKKDENIWMLSSKTWQMPY